MIETESRARHLEAAVDALSTARDELRRAGMEGEAETVAAYLAEIACDADAVAALEAGPDHGDEGGRGEACSR